MDFNTLEEATNAKTAMETMIINKENKERWPNVICKYQMPQWPGRECQLHHETEQHETVWERCRLENKAAAKRLLKKFPDDEKLKEALKGWVDETEMPQV